MRDQLKKIWSDINLAFIANPLTGDIGTLYDSDAIKRNLVHLMLMDKWSVPFDSTINSHIKDSLFELPGNITTANIRTGVEWIISNYEPRIIVRNINIELSQDESAYAITIEFLIKSILKEDTVNFFLSRVR